MPKVNKIDLDCALARIDATCDLLLQWQDTVSTGGNTDAFLRLDALIGAVRYQVVEARRATHPGKARNP